MQETQEMAETLDFATFEQGLDELMRQVCTVVSAIKLTAFEHDTSLLPPISREGHALSGISVP